MHFKTTSSIKSNTTNINSSTGDRECLFKELSTGITLFYPKSGEYILFLSSKSLTVAEKDFGSYTNTSYNSYLYFPKNKQDFEKIIHSNKFTNLPNNVLGNSFMRSFDPDTYYKDNNCPMTLSISSNRKHIMNCITNNWIPLQVSFYDDYVDDEGYHIYLDEDLAQTIYVSLNEFKNIISFKGGKKADLLWELLSVGEIYEGSDEILNDKVFINTLRESFKNLSLVNNTIDISKVYSNIHKKFNTAPRITSADNKIKKFSKELQTISNIHESFFKRNDEYKSVINKKTSYPSYVIKLVRMLGSNPVEADYAFYTLNALSELNKIPHEMLHLKSTSSIGIDKFFRMFAEHINVDVALFVNTILKHPIRIPVQLMELIQSNDGHSR